MCLRAAQAAQAELATRERHSPRQLTATERAAVMALGTDLQRVWSAPSTTDRDRKELLRTLIEEVIVALDRDKHLAHLTLRWRGGLISDLDVPLRSHRHAANRTDEDTIDLLRRLAAHYPDGVIAGILNRQGRNTANGLRFTANRVCSLRTHWKIPRFLASSEPPDGEVVSVREAARRLDVSAATIYRCIKDGLIRGEQPTPGAPWHIRMTEALCTLFVERAPEGFVHIADALRILGVSRQTVLQRVKRGELNAIHVCRGRRKGLRIQILDIQPGLFDAKQSDGV
jgi:excisionase family DNA binding protein